MGILKIIHLIGGGDVGGAKTHIFSLLTGLLKTHEVLLVSFRDGPFADEAREHGIPTEVISSGNILKDFKMLRRLYLKGGFDIVHCHGAKGNMMGAYLKVALGATVVTTVHSDYRLDYIGRPLGNLINGNINRLSLRIIKNRIGVSDVVAQMLIRRGFSPYGLFSIYNGLDFSIKYEPVNRAEYLKAYGMDVAEGDVVCGIAARLDPVKDMVTLIRAFAQTPDNVKLIIAGDGDQLPHLQNLATELGVRDRVCFAGWVNDVSGLYEAIDINLLTSISETFPYAIMEGATHKKATISSRVGGVPLLIDHGVNGFLFDCGDVDALALHLNTLSSDASLREEFGTKLYEKASVDFSLEATIARQNDIYNVIMRRKNNPPGRKSGVTICGSYGKGNAGDDAILEAIVSEVRNLNPDLRIRVLTRTPKTTRINYRVDSLYTFNIFALISAFRRSQLYINGGGNLMQDVTSTRSLLFYLFTIWLGKKLSCKVMMYGCGIGPISRPMNRKLTSKILNNNVDAITLREDGSLEELKLLDVTKPEMHLSSDPALILSPISESSIDSVMLSNGLTPGGAYICFVLRKWPSYDEKAKVFGEAANYAFHKHGLTPVFMSVDRAQDTEAALLASRHITVPFHIVTKPGRFDTIIGLMSRMSIVVSMRLHGLIFAAGQGIPLVGIVYDPKVSSFLKYMNQNLFTRIEDVTLEELKSLIDSAAEKDRAELLKEIEHLRSIEHINSDIAQKLLDGGPFQCVK